MTYSLQNMMQELEELVQSQLCKGIKELYYACLHSFSDEKKIRQKTLFTSAARILLRSPPLQITSGATKRRTKSFSPCSQYNQKANSRMSHQLAITFLRSTRRFWVNNFYSSSFFTLKILSKAWRNFLHLLLPTHTERINQLLITC